MATMPGGHRQDHRVLPKYNYMVQQEQWGVPVFTNRNTGSAYETGD